MIDKELVEYFDELLKPIGFRRRKTTWYKKASGSVQIIALSKSRFGHQFYVPFSCVPDGMEVDGMPTPKIELCAIAIRLDVIIPKEYASTYDLFDLENNTSDSDRKAEIQTIVLEYLVPFLQHLEDAESIINAMKKGIIHHNRVTLAGKAFLHWEEPEKIG